MPTPKPSALDVKMMGRKDAEHYAKLAPPIPNPDISPANVARVLREAADLIGPNVHATALNLHALADALERQAGVTWEERVRRAVEAHYAPHPVHHSAGDWPTTDEKMAQILAAAFPELAPPTETPNR